MDQGTARVREFRSYREILFKDAEITIEKNLSPRRIAITKKNTSLTYTTSSKKRLLEYKLLSKKSTHIVIFKSQYGFHKIGYYTKTKQKYFNSEPPACFTYNLSTNRQSLQNISDKITELNFANLLDPVTCSKLDKKAIGKLEEQFKTEFSPSESSLVECLSENKTVQEVLKRNNQYASFAFEALSKYLSLTNSIANGENPVKIRCESQDSVASLDESKNPIEMSFDLKKLVETSDVSQKMIISSLKLNNLKNHEDLHRGDSAIPTKSEKSDNAKNEQKVLYLNCLCTAASESSIQNQDCGKYVIENNAQFSKTETGATIKVKDGQQEDTKAIQDRIAQINREEKTSAELAKNTQPLTLTAAEESSIDTLAKAAFTTPTGTKVAANGESTTIAMTPEISSSLENIYNSASQKMTTIQAALQASVKTVQAAPSGSLAASYAATSPARGIASVTASSTKAAIAASPSGVSVLSREEIKADQESATFENATDSGTKLGTIAAVSALGGAAVAGKTGSTNSKIATASASGAGSNVNAVARSANPTSAPTTSTGGGSSTTSASSDENAEPTEESENQAASVAAPTTNRSPASISSAASQAPVDNRTLQQLSVLSEIKGNEYSKIQKNYSDSAFSKMLGSRKISISVQQKNGTYKFYGASPENASIKFIDTGRGLVKLDK